MDRLKYDRKPKRAQSTKTVNSIIDALAVDSPDLVELESNVAFLGELHGKIDELDQKIADLMFDGGVSEEEQNKELEECSNYKMKYLRVKKRVERLLHKGTHSESDVESVSNGAEGASALKRTFKLPKIELRKFTGELTDWLRFWSQFEKIDEDNSLHASDKFHYLSQAMTDGTDAYDIVASYPHSADNYPKVIEALKRRYGNRDFLLQVYIRELLKLVISNVNSQERMTVEALYLKLESHLRALKSLNLESADPASWLFPLVESSIPEELLITWQRSPLSKQDGGQMNPPRSRLDIMMEFLCQEVEFRQRVVLAQGGFHSDAEKKTQSNSRKNRRQDVPALASFIAGESSSCVFCNKSHLSQECFKAQKMTLQDKHKVLKNKRRCFLCFSEKHISRNCNSNVKCVVCQKKHYTVMCPDVRRGNDPKKDDPSEKTEGDGKTDLLVGMASHNAEGITCSKKVPLMTLMVVVYGHNKKKLIRATYDPGSQRSYFLKSLAAELQLQPVSSERVVISLFGGSTTEPTDQYVYHAEVASKSERYKCKMEFRDRERICQRVPRVSKKEQQFFKILKEHHVFLTDVGDDIPEIEMLIGNDYFGRLISGRKVDLQNGITAIDTKLGWVLSGSFQQDEMNSVTTLLSMSVNETSITQLWDLDTIGVRDAVEVISEEEAAAEAKANLIKDMTRGADGRYCVALPWKSGHPPLPRNREVAMKRLNNAVKKLDDNDLFEVYDRIFMDWEKQGFIERVPERELENKSHLLPHRPVLKPDSMTTPVRPVFDGSCKTGRHPSFNDCQEKGVTIMQLIPDIILKFREKEVAFISDIKKAFQMIDVMESDRDMMRFLWFENRDRSKVIEFRHRRVMFGASSSPFILGTVLEHHLTNVKDEDKPIATKLLHSMYVDNCVASVDNVEQYEEFRRRSTELLAEAQMDLRLWMNNVDVEDNETRVAPVLGLNWDRKEDSFFVSVPTWEEKPVTKRVILSYVHQVFDPIGFTAPALIVMKMLLQEVWVAKKKWDDELPAGIVGKWVGSLLQLAEIRVPRLVTGGVSNRDQWSIHLFTDASGLCYAAAVFLRVENNGEVILQLLEAKARVAPLRSITIPRLELLGCLIGSRMMLNIRHSLNLDGVQEYYWTDSATALAWIRRQDNWATWVGNRVSEIGRNTIVNNWNHVAGTNNPADLPSRGCSISRLVESKWWEGPMWLRRKPGEWPRSRIAVNEEEVEAEKRKTPVKVVAMTTIEGVRGDHTFPQLVRIQAYVLRFCYAVTNKIKVGGPLSMEELRRAEIRILKEVQEEAFPQADKDGIPGYYAIRGEDELLRLRTRIVLRPDLVDFKCPVVLPRRHPVVTKIIEDAHRNYCHAGVQFLMCKLRERYWIIQSRRAVKRVVEKCARCRRYSAKPVVVECAPLPLDRIQDADVFQVVGVDLAGPLQLKNGKKAWIVVFTCAVFRAVHLEVVTSLSTQSFIQSLQKFVMRHGRPDTIYSDNGTNFVGAANLFKEIDWAKVSKERGIRAITWKRNPPSAAWWGGWWERLIRSMKDIMRRMLGKGSLSLEGLRTMLFAVEEVMNDRPLTYVSEDANDLQPLTPAMFLRPYRTVQFPEAELGTAKMLRMKYRHMQTLKEDLKNRFRTEYLSQLIQKPRGRPTRPIQVGEIVVVGRDDKKRVEWPLGRVLELIAGKDGKHRVARVRVQGGELLRPLQRLYPLEVADDCNGEREVEKVLKTRYGRIVKPPRNP